MYFPIHSVPEAFDKFVLNFIDLANIYITEFDCIPDCTDAYISEILYIHELLIVENGPVWS